jgi:hypothetical protein
LKKLRYCAAAIVGAALTHGLLAAAATETFTQNFGTVVPTADGLLLDFQNFVQPGDSFSDTLSFNLTQSASVEAGLSGATGPGSPISFLGISSSVGNIFGFPSHSGNFLTSDFDGQFPDPIYSPGSYSFMFTGFLVSTQTAAAPFGLDVRLTAVSAPEIDPSSWFTGVTLLLGSAMVIRGRRVLNQKLRENQHSSFH